MSQVELTSGTTLATLRRRSGLTLDDLAARAGCTKQYVSKLEHGGSRFCSERIAEGIKAALAQALQEALQVVADSLFVPRHLRGAQVEVARDET
jgi:transcriptional regulator with XRE-family HTH domain